jgi:hypothetical protein
MPFPKFTSGGSGRLTFDVMNELFARVEKLEGKARPGGLELPKMKHAFFARVTAQNTGANAHQFSFAEVCRQNPQTAYSGTLDPAAWTPVNGGQTSAGVPLAGGTVSSFRYPLIGSGIAVGTILPIVASVDEKGNLVYVPIQAGGGSVSFPARIVGYQNIEPEKSWRYSVKRAVVAATATQLDFTDISDPMDAWNGAEWVVDSPSSSVFGVGMEPQPSPTLQLIRQPIRVGVHVVVVDDGNGKLVFSMPNGYKVIC